MSVNDTAIDLTDASALYLVDAIARAKGNGTWIRYYRGLSPQYEHQPNAARHREVAALVGGYIASRKATGALKCIVAGTAEKPGVYDYFVKVF